MDSACGPPEAMAERREELTPMMRQYHDLCARYDDALVLFQVGDFYETFCEAAERTARLLEVTLTSREDSTGEYPMTGIPVDNAASYVETLLEAGYRVAIADQVEEPEATSGVVERAVTRVITPGTLTEDELLADDDNNFVAAVARDGPAGASDVTGGSADGPAGTSDVTGGGVDGTRGGADGLDGGLDGSESWGLALLDVSTGDFLATGSRKRRAIADELARFDPAEAILGPGVPPDVVGETCPVTDYDRTAFDRNRAGALVAAYFGDPDALLADDAEIRACGALLSYAEYARGGLDLDGGSTSGDGRDGNGSDADGRDGNGSDASADDTAGAGRPVGDDPEPRLAYLTHLTRYDPREYLLLDAVALESLELFEPRTVRGSEEATLIGVLDETASALGGRKLADWLRRPSLDPAEIESRLDAVEELLGAVRRRERLRESLRDVYDLERLIGRISRERADARDLRSLCDTLAVVPEVREALADADADRLETLHDALDPLADVRGLIDRAIVENPPIEITEGGVIAEGFDAELDALRETAREGKRWVDDLEAGERERTGIDSLSVGYNAVHGYYIEVTNPNLEAVPENYRRRQTLKNSERFVTPELKAREDEIVGAEGRADDREYELFREVRRAVADEVERVQTLAEALATVDALVSLATVAAEYGYSRPEIVPHGRRGVDADVPRSGSDGGTAGDGTGGETAGDGDGGATEWAAAGDGDEPAPRIRIEGGRHPVVERTQPSFVPNDARLGPDRRLAIVTGPNMSGKSTYMRGVALIVVLAQIGSFVPAERVRLTPVERIFTRVGASDDIAGGRSTFMVEMEELATILAEADARSLVLLDEIGRGTSTADGVAIARAMVEHLHDEVGALTLFATHHHPLTALADELAAAHNLRFTASHEDGELVFDHEIAPGAAAGSYGVEVATAAGLPDTVVERARTLLGADGPGAGGSLPVPGDADDAPTATDDGATAGADGRGATTADGGDDPTDVAAELRALEIAHLTPVEALAELDRLKRSLEE